MPTATSPTTSRWPLSRSCEHLNAIRVIGSSPITREAASSLQHSTCPDAEDDVTALCQEQGKSLAVAGLHLAHDLPEGGVCAKGVEPGVVLVGAQAKIALRGALNQPHGLFDPPGPRPQTAEDQSALGVGERRAGLIRLIQQPGAARAVAFEVGEQGPS